MNRKLINVKIEKLKVATCKCESSFVLFQLWLLEKSNIPNNLQNVKKCIKILVSITNYQYLCSKLLYLEIASY